MDLQAFRQELTEFYWHKADDMADAFRDKIFPILDASVTPTMNAYQRKALQYDVIAEHCRPVLFHTSPFYHELGTMIALCDGCGDFHGHLHAGGWNYDRYQHLFRDQDPALYDIRSAQGSELLYLICGPYCDTRQHFIFNCKPIYQGGLKGMYDEAQAQLALAETDEERDFLQAASEGLLCLKRISEKFAKAAAERLREATDPEEIANLRRIADSAAHTPWHAPRSFYEALNMLAFIRTVCGALEGVGYNTFGRPDVELYPFYQKDLAEGRLSKEEAYELIRAFLLTWDLHYDHDMKMVGYADHELENTYTLGGCDAEGNPVWNDLTAMFLKATREQKIIFPKGKVRFSANSPKEYLDAADEDVIHGTSSILYQNDDTCIPALVRSGISLEDARDYLISGCWGMMPYGNLMDDHGNYVNLLKAFEFSVHNRQDKMEKCHLQFLPLDGAQSFEDVYRITLENCRILFRERNRMTLLGKPIWSQIDPLPLTSASMTGCLESRKDLTAGGCKYHDEHYACVGFPNIVDSLLAIKTLCFDQQKYTLQELLSAVRKNWEDCEDMRRDAIRCPCWGDESEESCALARRFNTDLYEALRELKTLWPGGHVRLGHLTYTEIRFWAEKTLATPDGRHSGEYFSQGLTPSRLHKIESVTSVVNSLAALDGSEMGGNNVVNIILPSNRMTLDNCAGFLRACAHSAMGSLQLNCVTKEELLDAQAHPENHRDLIVRVCGFSARFTSLSPEWQKEVLTRNFYD
ncbi:MAG: pyruvate formate lyase family protein [Eubacteriales bacterium]|nr:pyruvate formate lyase family protein [Eubacteriales bacterium]